MKIEVGKSYRTRDGCRVHVIRSLPDYSYPFRGDRASYTSGGEYLRGQESPHDIIAPWEDAPFDPIAALRQRAIEHAALGCEDGNVCVTPGPADDVSSDDDVNDMVAKAMIYFQNTLYNLENLDTPTGDSDELIKRAEKLTRRIANDGWDDRDIARTEHVIRALVARIRELEERKP